MASEIGVTFEWPDECGRCSTGLGYEMSHGMQFHEWWSKLAANLAMAALLGAAARQAVNKMTHCHDCGEYVGYMSEYPWKCTCPSVFGP